jgi:hypothetical protein
MQQKVIHGPVYGRNDNLMSFAANLDVHDTKARQTSTRLLLSADVLAHQQTTILRKQPSSRLLLCRHDHQA